MICHLAIVYKKPFIAVVSRQENDAYECLSTLEELGLMERVIYIEDDVRERSISVENRLNMVWLTEN